MIQNQEDSLDSKTYKLTVLDTGSSNICVEPASRIHHKHEMDSHTVTTHCTLPIHPMDPSQGLLNCRSKRRKVEFTSYC